MKTFYFSRVGLVDLYVREHRRSTGRIPFLFPLFLFPSIERSSQTVLCCAHRTSTALSCAFCEQERRSGCPLARDCAFHDLGCLNLIRLPPSHSCANCSGTSGWLDCPSLSASSDHHFSIFSLEGGLDGLPLRVSNEGLLRPRVARAQETI
jgi:hypothetical protein